MDVRRAASIALMIFSWAFRLAAIALAAIVVLQCFSGMTLRWNLVDLVIDISRALPKAISGYGLVTTPFGGVFRFDFAFVAACLFACDYLCQRVAHALRR